MLRDLLCTADESSTLNVDPQELDIDALAEQLEWALPAEIEFVCERIEYLAARTGDGSFTQAEIEDVIDEVRYERECAAPERFADDPRTGESASDGVTGRHLVEETDITYDDIGGLDSVIDRLTELLVVPEQYPTLFENSNLQATRGVLLHGPPGNGKTLLARALATETDRTFLSVRGPELKNKWFGESEQRIRDLFETADEQAPSIVFFDELDAIAGDRNACSSSPTTSMVNMLLSEMDGLEERGDVLFLAATNRIDALDEAVLRPGRIGATVEITPPDATGQAEIFEIYAADLPTDDDVTPGWFADTAPAGLSGAEIEGVCRQALHAAVRESDERVTIAQEHVTQGLNSV
jgi:SpoVK/Ycf46/Vps4 family AAA+-type ATPase